MPLKKPFLAPLNTLCFKPPDLGFLPLDMGRGMRLGLALEAGFFTVLGVSGKSRRGLGLIPDVPAGVDTSCLILAGV